MKFRNALFCSIIALGALAMPASARVNIVVGIAPPAPIIEVVPPPRIGFIWVQGYWGWDGYRHVWVHGRWIRERPGYAWSHERWERREGRYYFVPGRWEQRREYGMHERERDHDRGDREHHHGRR